MAEYYLISQLPSLDGISEDSPIPITEEQFNEICEGILRKKTQEILKKITLLAPKNFVSSGSNLIDAWNDSERNLRFALGKVRAEKMCKIYDEENKSYIEKYLKVASVAVEIENPLEAEKYLNKFRLEILESLRPMDIFSKEYIFYYGLKLKLILRIRQFDATTGEKVYRNIYNSILNGCMLEEK